MTRTYWTKRTIVWVNTPSSTRNLHTGHQHHRSLPAFLLPMLCLRLKVTCQPQAHCRLVAYTKVCTLFMSLIFFSVLPVSLYVFQSAFVCLQGNVLPRLLASHVSCYPLIGVIRVLIILSSLYRTPITIHPRASCILHITILFTITPPSSIPVNTAAHPPAILSE